MKHQAAVLLLASAVTLPVFANDEIDAGNLPQPVPAVKSRAQVTQELVAARTSGDWRVNPSLGTVSLPGAPAYAGAKSRTQVRAELEQAYRDGDSIANWETGDTASHL